MIQLMIKSKALASAKLDFVREGFFRGVLGVQIEMSGVALSFEDVQALMLELTTMSLPARKIVRFSGAFNEGDMNFLILANSLFDHGFELQCVISNAKTYAWLKWFSWIIITSTEKLILLSSNEVWYTPVELVDVILPSVGKMPFLFLSGRHAVDDVVAFMCASRLTWATL